MERRGFAKILTVAFLVLVAYVFISSAFFILRYGFCPFCSVNWRTRTVYPEKPIVEQPNPNYLKDKLSVEPKSFPYKRVELNPLMVSKIAEESKLDISWKHAASFEVKSNEYITLFNKDGTNLFFIVYWINESKPVIMRSSYGEAKYIGKITYESKLVKDRLFNNTYYKTKGEVDYYELDIKIASYDGSSIAGTLYHIYDFTTQECYLGTELIYSVTAAEWAYVNYGIEAWVDKDVSYGKTHDPIWIQCSFDSRIIANHGPSASIRADGKASAPVIPGITAVEFDAFACVSVNFYGEGSHDGQTSFYSYPGLPCLPYYIPH
jgi:hypothetical protein